jgi:hypothetical protein
VLTDKGEKELIGKLIYNLSHREKIVSSLDVSIANLSMLSKKQILVSLNKYVYTLDSRIEGYKVRAEQINSKFIDEEEDMFYLSALTERHIVMLEAEKLWLTNYIDEISKKMK